MSKYELEGEDITPTISFLSNFITPIVDPRVYPSFKRKKQTLLEKGSMQTILQKHLLLVLSVPFSIKDFPTRTEMQKSTLYTKVKTDLSVKDIRDLLVKLGCNGIL